MSDRAGPPSIGQRGLVLQHRLAPHGRALTIAHALRLRGPLDEGALARALDGAVARHGALRTALVDRDGEPWRAVIEHAAIAIAPAADERALAAALWAPWELARAPLVRASLLRIGPDEHVLGLALHHAIADLWTMAIVARDLARGYAAARAGRSDDAPPPAATYADFVAWQAAHVAGPGAADRAWWRARLDGVPAALDLPYDGARDAVPGDGLRAPLPIDDATAAALRATARALGTTLPSFLLAAWQAFLARHTGAGDVVVGVPVPGRIRGAWADTAGYFVNPLPVRAAAGPGVRFAELVRQTASGVREALRRQDVPFATMLEDLRLPRTGARLPLVPAMFLYQRVPRGADPALAGLAVGDGSARLALDDVAVTAAPLAEVAAPCDLTLACAEHGGRLTGALLADRAAFSAATTCALAARFVTFVRSIAREPDARVGTLALADGAGRRAAIARGTGPTPPRPLATVTSLLAAQALRTPDALAIDAGATRLTYRALAERARAIGHALRRRGARRGTAVGLALERSPELVTTWLGVLASGAAYVPLDPALPAARRAAMIDDAAIAVVVDAPVTTFAPAGELDDPPRPDDAVSILFTSGSTGRPKGVISTHRGLANRLAWFQDTYPLGPGDRVIMKTPLGFDVSAGEVLGALIAGATLVIAPPGAHQDAAAMVDAIAGGRVTQAHFVPSMLRRFLAEPDVERCTALRRILCSGEALTAELAAALHARLAVELVNLYGPTEAAVEVTHAAIAPAHAGPVPIGRPIAHATVVVVDDALAPLPPGAVGEIAIAGAPLARGYVAQPELTAAAFVAAPADLGGRLYRTGDLGRVEPDGAIAYLGRRDHQVKLRGVRLELDEVEAALRALPTITDAAAAVRRHGGEDHLVAYAVPRAGATLAPAAVRAALAERLPSAFVPSMIVAVPALPHTASGKLDRARLPALGWGGAGDDDRAEAPRDDLERAIAGWFGEVLGLPPPGRHADFFQLGGHSLLAARVMGRVAAHAGVELPLATLFAAPTVAGLARQVRTAAAGDRDGPIAPRGAAEPVLSFAQERMWFLDQLTPGPIHNLPLALRVRGPLDAGALAAALAAIVARHASLRTAIVARDGAPHARIAAAVTPDWAELDCAGAADPEAAALALATAEARRPFDLAHAPLLRARLYRLGDGDHLLALVLHHAAGDGWSWGVLARELAAHHDAARAGRTAALPALPVSYADVAAWQRRRATPARLAPSLAVWTRRLAAPLPTLALPADRPRTARRTLAGAVHAFDVPATTTAALDAIADACGATRFMALFAVYAAQLARYTGQTDLVIGVPVAGRGRAELDGLLGCFVATLALRIDLSDRPSFRTVIARVREVALEAFAHAEVPLEHLVQAVNPTRDARETPLFQTVFALQNAAGAVPALAGLAVERVALSTGVARFELGLALEETAGGLAGTIEYQTELFDAATIARFAAHFVRLCAEAARDPDRPIARLPMLTRAELAQVVIAWNQTARPLPAPATLPARFAHHAVRRPDAIAVVHGARSLTYGELSARAGALATRLRARGAGPGTFVGLALPRGPELVVAMLAVAMAGAAYVPLDPAHPPERLAFLRDDAGLTLTLEDRDLDGDRDPTGAAPPDDATPDGAAYLLYTSGSTGRPKGVVIPHRAIVRLVCETDYIELGPDDRVAQLASAAFDAATFEIWGALLTGARLVIIDRETTLAPRALAAALHGAGITVTMLTTALFNRLAAEAPAVLRAIATVYFGGEAVDPGWVRAIVRRPGTNRILHGYGPTECTVAATWHHVTDVPDDATTIPIGRPIANTRCYVLDGEGQPAPIGVPGELHLGGPGLALGYHRRPAETAARFVELALPGAGVERLYRSGDLARWRADGTLEFVGRVDDQVKIRGQRVEPGEIEVVLAAHPAVRACAVIARDDARLGRHLVAYVEPAPASGAGEADWRAHLRAHLPAYMVPARFVALARLPLGPTGKLDRRALPPPGEPLAAAPPAALTPTEAALAAIWTELLGAPPASPAHGFFDAGGHSLLAAQLAFRAGERLGVELPLRAVFEDPTLAGLARALDAARAGGDRERLATLRAAPDGRPAFFVHPVGGTAFCYRALVAALPGRGPRHALQDLDDVPARSIEELASLHLATLRAAAGEAPLQLVGWSFGGVVAFELARQARAAGLAVDRVILLDTLAPGAPVVDAPPPAGDRLARVAARNLAALRAYRPAPVELPLTLVLAADRDPASHAATHAAWRALTHRAAALAIAPGDHHSMLQPPHVDALARLLDAALA